MASIVTSILSKCVGLLFNKALDKTADKLKDGDITDAKIREIIVRELNDVKTKLDGLSRKDLNSSYNFLQEGVNLLKAFLDKSIEKQKSILKEAHDDVGETSTKPSDDGPGILTEALTLSQAMGRVKINSDEELIESAKKRFEDARKEATKAYGIETLRIEDRILAAKLRIVSELLECLERPDTTIINCLPFLGKLHSLPAIREIFSVYINGGYKSMVGKAERAENVKAVMLINYVLFQFISQFSSKYCSAISWPTIELADRSFRPIFDWKEISTRRSWGEEFVQPPNKVILNTVINRDFCAVNSHGEVIVREMDFTNVLSVRGDCYIKVISRTGEVKVVKLNYRGSGGVIKRHFTGLAVDCSDNVYVLMCLQSRTEIDVVSCYVLYIFDKNYNVKQSCTLQFLNATCVSVADIAIDKNNNIITMVNHDPHVYVCDNAGLLKHKFQRDSLWFLRSLTTSDANEILFASVNFKAVHRYTEKGVLESTIEAPEGHVIRSVAFHHVICKIIVLTFNEESDSHFVFYYSDTGELENSKFIVKGYKKKMEVRSHPSGPAVVVSARTITFI